MRYANLRGPVQTVVVIVASWPTLILLNFPIWIVKADATGTNKGGSWKNAYISLQTALNNATSGDQIWIAAGTYSPGNTSTDYFNMVDGVSIYGGFNGTETDLAQRDPLKNTSIIHPISGGISSTERSEVVLRFKVIIV